MQMAMSETMSGRSWMLRRPQPTGRIDRNFHRAQARQVYHAPGDEVTRTWLSGCRDSSRTRRHRNRDRQFCKDGIMRDLNSAASAACIFQQHPAA